MAAALHRILDRASRCTFGRAGTAGGSSDPPPTVVTRDGKWIKATLQREGLDDDDLGAALREYGLEKIDEARLVTLEHDGSISVVARQGKEIRIRARRRRFRHRAPSSQ